MAKLALTSRRTKLSANGQTPKAGRGAAATGGRVLLTVGPPGSGKSMLAARLPGILPPLEPAEALDIR